MKTKAILSVIALTAVLALGLWACGNSGSGTRPNLTNAPNGGATVPATSKAFLYITNAGNANTISAFQIDNASGALTPVPGSPFASNRNTPGQAAADPLGRVLFVVNTGSNTITSYSIAPSTGTITPVTTLPTDVLPTGIAVHPAGTFVYVVNQTSGDVTEYGYDPNTGALASLSALPGSNPPSVPVLPGATNVSPARIAVNSQGQFAYVTTRLGIVTFRINSDGTLSPSTLPPIAAGQLPIAIASDPAGGFIYAADSGAASGAHGGIFGFAVDSNTGALTPVPGSSVDAGVNPATLAVSFTGKFVFVGSGSSGQGVINTFAISTEDGALSPVSSVLLNSPPTPVQLAADPSGNFLYSANQFPAPALGLGATGDITGFNTAPNQGRPALLSPSTPTNSPAGLAVARLSTGAAQILGRLATPASSVWRERFDRTAWRH